MGFYQNYDTSFDSKYKLSGYKLGTTTNPTIANQLEEFGTRLNEGVNNIEIGALRQDIFETIPKQNLKDIKQLSKLTGTNVSMHAPLIDPAGFPSKEGAEPKWSEQQRRANEQEIKSVITRAYDLGKNGNVPVVLHGGTMFSQEEEKGLTMIDPETKKLKPALRSMAVVNQDTGQMTVLKYEKKYPLGVSKEDIEDVKTKVDYDVWDPMTRLGALNRTEWDEEKLKLLAHQKSAAELEDRKIRVMQSLAPLQYGEKHGILSEQEKIEQARLHNQIRQIDSYINQVNTHTAAGMKELHHKFEKFKDTKKEEHKDYSKKEFPQMKEEWDAYQKKIDKVYKEFYKKAESTKDINKLQQEYIPHIRNLTDQQNKAMTMHLAKIPSPELWTPVKDFSIKQASTTIANVALDGFKKFGEKAPILAVENSYPNMPLATGKDLRSAIEEARNKFVKQAVKVKNISKEEAKRISEKLIGATWDLGHMNMLRKAGYEGEELKKKILEETKKISPFIKHLHLSDNFGFADIHLPPGMGNVPIKEVLEELEKKEGKRMDEVRHILETGGFVNAFKQNPFLYSLEHFESPLYKMGAGPYWQQDIQGHYQTPYIEFSPIHFDLYGSGFSTLPKEIGGQVGGEKGRFMEGGKEEQPYQ